MPVSLKPRAGRARCTPRVASAATSAAARVAVDLVSVVLVSVVLVSVASCSSADRPVPASSVDPSARVTARVSVAPTLSPADRATVLDLLRRRAAAVVAGDEPAYAATVADPSGADGRRQLAGFAAARALRVSRLDVALAAPEPGAPGAASAPPPGSTPVATTGPGRAGTTFVATPGTTATTVKADVRYRVDDLDTADRTARLTVDLLVLDGGRWAVAAEEPEGSGAAPPWLAVPDLRVRRGRHAVVAGTVPASRLDELARVVDRTLPPLRGQWTGTPGRVLVLAPATAVEADGLLGRDGSSPGAEVAATTEGPTGPDGRATGDRVVLDPTAYGRLTASGRDVVLAHELAHVAVRSTVPGRPATWLAEGYADHVGYAHADVSDDRLLTPLLEQVRAGRLPSGLPGPAELQPASGDIEAPYLAAWQAVELLVEEHGEDAVRRLVTAGASTGSEADAEAATDAALETVLHTSREQLTRAWQQRLRDLAG